MYEHIVSQEYFSNSEKKRTERRKEKKCLQIINDCYSIHTHTQTDKVSLQTMEKSHLSQKTKHDRFSLHPTRLTFVPFLRNCKRYQLVFLLVSLKVLQTGN